MIRAVTILTENFSDWEPALINSTGRAYYGFDTRFATPGGKQVTSSGGMMIVPNLAVEAIQLEDVDLLIVTGSPIWKTDKAPAIEALVREAHAMNIVVAGICDGTRVLAQAGILDHLQHTSNSAENLKQSHYCGADYYQDVPYAVADQGVVTAPGSAPVSFMAQILNTLGLEDEKLDAYVAMHAAEHIHC
ncbi:type 1 glutamine amidotransferase family protein [Pseudomonas orientalis]|uniref:DJ-1/PfpI family protein n=1 Tax=Pseudomonas orientalis TaxID=76758 RepID=A0A0R3A110_9PSED|nr:type 1 glutamine amidotransferase family protein [Pseudomonas orientalis]AZE89276.1 ThiJ/PfpI family protein [Pseudomonas orientalis]KRP66992.1 glutamine amidotransferase [Pseudomonas orientalis]SDT92320.1 DJ-1/PfpI family protein [Pseudomonas orientalis]